MDREEQVRTETSPPVSFEEFPSVSYEEWRKEAEAALKGAPFEKRLVTRTYEGISLQPLYTEENAPLSGQAETFPGAADYLRGTDPLGYVRGGWAIAQKCGDALPERTNALLREELASGATAVHIALDGATLRCLDVSDEGCPFEDEGGVSLATLRDMDALLDGVELRGREVHLYGGESAAPILALFAARLRARGEAALLEEISGCIGADPLGALALDGTLSCPLDALYDEMGLVTQWAQMRMPRLRTVMVRGDVYHEGGGSAVQELGCAMATGIAYVRALLRRGFGVNTAAAQMRFCFSQGANFFMEIAKLRAARMLWAQIVQAFGGSGDACRIDLFASTSRFTTTIYDPYVNVLRASTQAFSAVVGGVKGMHVGWFDEAVRPPEGLSRRIARNMQLLLRDEFHLLQPLDPAGGSWYVEALTQQLAERAWDFLQRIEAEGGMVQALQSGLVQREIGDVFAERLKNLDFRTDRAVGVNMYADLSETPLPLPETDRAAVRESRRRAVATYRELMDDLFRRERLGVLLDQVSGPPGAFLDALVEAFLAGASLSEVREVLDDGFSGDVVVSPLRPHRWTEKYEALRRRTEEAAARTGRTFRVFLANMGPLAQHKARADFSAAFMEVAGFQVLRNDGFATVEEAVQAAAASEADVAVLCSTDETYPELVPPLAAGIKAARPDMAVLLAGAPAPEHKEDYVRAGVDEFIHLRANCYAVLDALLRARGIC